jgi:MscS family membrane protein
MSGSASAQPAIEEVPIEEGTHPPAPPELIERSIEALMPPAWRSQELLGLALWQWLTLLALIVLAVVADAIAKVLFGRLLPRWCNRRKQLDDTLVEAPARPLGLLIGAVVVRIALPFVALQGAAAGVAFAAVELFLVLSWLWAAFTVIDLFSAVGVAYTAQTRTKFDDILVPLLRKSGKVFALAIGLLYGAKAISIDILPLLTGLGIGSLAFAFAAKDTIENFFGSVAVILDRPFEVGDWVTIDDVDGTVEELGFRSTRIRTFYNSQVTVPTANLVRANVDNYGRRKYRRWKTTIGLQYDTPPDLLVAFTEGVRELVRTHPYTRKDYYQVYMHDWADSSLNMLLYVFFETPDWHTELRERERLFIDIMRLADRLGVSMAFPTRTIHLYQEEHPPRRSAAHTKPRAAEEAHRPSGKGRGPACRPGRDRRPALA